MSAPHRHRCARQRGAVAVELALSLPVLLTMLVALAFYGRVLYNYEVVQKAAWSGARYLSSVPAASLRSPQQAAHEVALTTDLIASELSAVSPAPGKLFVSISCDGEPCGGLSGYLPVTVTVVVRIDVPSAADGYAANLAMVRVRASHSLRYVGI